VDSRWSDVNEGEKNEKLGGKYEGCILEKNHGDLHGVS
jgi:hypothetical protein